MRVDLKSVVLGLLLGVLVVFALAARGGGGGTSSVFGFAVPAGGKAIIKAENGDAFIIDADSAKAQWVLFKRPATTGPGYPSVDNGYQIKLAD